MKEFRLLPYEFEEPVSSVSYVEVPYGIDMIKASHMWDQSVTGGGVVVAVLDTGAKMNHPDLQGQIIGYRNFTAEGGPEDVTDYNGHGTHVAGTIAAKVDNAGVVGVAPNTKLLILKVLESDGRGSLTWITDALKHAVVWRGSDGQRVQVISMSLGGPINYPGLHDAIKAAVDSNILVVCAAGNDGDGSPKTDEYAFPGSYDEVLQVGACNGIYQIASFSNSNNQVDLVAPGVGVKSSWKDGKWAVLSGTSMATPHVSGAAALIIQQWRKEKGTDPTELQLYAQLARRTVYLDADIKEQGNGLLTLTRNHHINPNTIPLSVALQALTVCRISHSGGNDVIINTIDFWTNLVAKFNKDPEAYKDFRYVETLIRRFAAYIM